MDVGPHLALHGIGKTGHEHQEQITRTPICFRSTVSGFAAHDKNVTTSCASWFRLLGVPSVYSTVPSAAAAAWRSDGPGTFAYSSSRPAS